jgi:hypothetical protein
VLWNSGAVAGQQRHASLQGAGGEVLGQLAADGGIHHDPGGGDQLLRLAADVGGIPRGTAGGQPGQHGVDGSVAVQPAHRGRDRVDGPAGVAVAEGDQLGHPSGGEVLAGLRDDLVRAALGPRPRIPGPPQRRPGRLAGVCGRPLPFVAIPVVSDLRGPGAEGTDVASELQYFSSRAQGVAVAGQCGAELRVGGDRGVPDPVERGEEVPHADGVQPPPSPGGQHPGVDLQVQMPVRIPGPGGVVAHRHRLQHLHRNLHLPAARPHPGGRMLGQPADDLSRRAVLRGVVRRGDVRVQRSSE